MPSIVYVHMYIANRYCKIQTGQIFGQPSIFGENNYLEPISVKDPFLGKVATGKGPFLSQESSPCNWERFQQFLEQFLSQERILSQKRRNLQPGKDLSFPRTVTSKGSKGERKGKHSDPPMDFRTSFLKIHDFSDKFADLIVECSTWLG